MVIVLDLRSYYQPSIRLKSCRMARWTRIQVTNLQTCQNNLQMLVTAQFPHIKDVTKSSN